MKKLFKLFLLVFLMFVFVGCETKPAEGNQENGNISDGGEQDPNGGNEGNPNGGGESDPNGGNEGDPNGGGETEPIVYLTVTEAYNLAIQAGDKGTDERKYVKGTVKNITNSLYGEMYITDGVNDLYVYGVYSSDGVLRYSEMEEKPYSNDEVCLYGYLKTYNEKPELGASWLISFVSHQEEIDLSEYTEKKINEVRLAEVDSKVIVSGVVAYVTYASGMKPNGLYLVDETGSIYIYGLEVAGRVKIGDKVKIAGSKTLYILDSEKEYAATYGYQGSIQIQDALFISKEEGEFEFDKTWIEESTVKEILETPMTSNITTNIYKVKAIINEVPGSGFTNFYIDDLDNKTGSYCYSLCNGGDFTYLREFDGKICDVYLSALNCKSTKSGTVYRFIPVLVEECTDFAMTDKEVCEFVLEYYIKTQFQNEYDSDPELDLILNVSDTLLNFKNVEISYSSEDSEVMFNERGQEELVMNLAKTNKIVTIKMDAKYKTATASVTKVIQINDKAIPETISISDVLRENDNETVTIRGIVMSGCVNQPAFYLNDGTGVIAVRTDSATLKKISLGNDVIVTGKKCHIVKDGANMVGQICVDNATLVLNLLGSHEYDTSTFITNKTFDDMISLIATGDDLTSNVYVVKCYLKKVVSQYSTNYYLTSQDKTKDIYLYAGSGSQYAIYEEFVGDIELTVTFMLVNWNSKTPYRGCIVTATDGETIILNNYNFR